MQDNRKTKAALIEELTLLRGRVKELEALKESEQKFRSLAESTTALISILQDGRYVYANQAFLDYYWLEASDLERVNPEDLMLGSMDAETMKRAAAEWEAAMARGDSRLRFEYQDLDGRWFQVNVTMMVLGGKPAFLGLEFDITDIKRAESEMYRADKMAALGEIVAGVAHEINNPNNFIYFNLPILRKYIEAMRALVEAGLEAESAPRILGMPYAEFTEELYKLIENMEHGSARITGIVSDLKHYIRSDDSSEWQAVSMDQVVRQVMTLVGKQVRKQVKKFEVEVADRLPQVEMNVGKIEQVLINLLINAGQAADKVNSRVNLSVRRSTGIDDMIVIEIKDNGVGIPKRHLDRIFEPFFTSKGRDKGTGLGLSISHRIVEEHGGRISVESTVGEGACFKVHLPVTRHR
jgi:PAS domain S-box-containing protein